MAANNETGTVMPIADIGQVAAAHGILFHTDAVQAVGHIAIDVNAMHIDLLSMSAHKFYGPKGVGALYIRQGTDIGKYMHGGSQETGMRGSTLNTPGIVGLGAAIQLAMQNMAAQAAAEAGMAAQLIGGLLKLPGTQQNGHKTQRLPGTVNISFEGIEAEALMIRLDMEGIAVSTGSACTSGSTEPSYVLTEMGLSHTDARGAVRFTIGRENTPEQMDTVIQAVTHTVNSLREISPLFAQKKGGQHYV
jgi:cysteine desulfurase